ncbi:uncharacterized protein [Euwallacea similis]|uniref:uncharacterized protein n=1 Tax=Euwallacea similis TaxID=1736056 RepID=UPI00345074A4
MKHKGKSYVEKSSLNLKPSKLNKTQLLVPNNNTVQEQQEIEERTFSQWLTSEAGIDNLKFFILGNALIWLSMVTWPHVKEVLDAAYYRYFVFLCIMFIYSFAALKLVDGFFRERFNKYLAKEFKQNKYKSPKFFEEIMLNKELQSFPDNKDIVSCHGEHLSNTVEGLSGFLEGKFAEEKNKCSWYLYIENVLLYRSPLFNVY